jgi:hypothetical protein
MEVTVSETFRSIEIDRSHLSLLSHPKWLSA